MAFSISRRSLFGFAVAGALAVAAPALAFTLTPTNYTEAELTAAKASGEPFLLDFYAPWCSTCRAQERVIEGLMDANPAYQGIKVIRVDWDTNRTGPLVAELQIPRRSTLVVMQGETELGRVVADTREDSLAALLDLAV